MITYVLIKDVFPTPLIPNVITINEKIIINKYYNLITF